MVDERSPLEKFPDKWVGEEGVAPEWAGGLHVRYKLVSTICVPLKDLDSGRAQALLVQASKRREGEICSTSNPLEVVVGTPYHHLPCFCVAFERCWQLVLVEQINSLVVGATEHAPATDEGDVCDWPLPGPLKDKLQARECHLEPRDVVSSGRPVIELG